MTDNFTLKDLVIDFNANDFTTAFGISVERGKEILKEVNEIAKEIRRNPTWSPAQLLQKAVDRNLARNAREVALVLYILGCHVGETNLYQSLIEKYVGAKIPALHPLKKKGKYVN